MQSARTSSASLLGFGAVSRNLANDLAYLARRVITLSLAYGAVGAVKDWIETGFRQILVLDQLNKSTQSLVATQLIYAGKATDFNDALAQGADEASRLFEWNKKLAVVSIFTTEQITELQQMAMAVGINSEQARILTADFVTWGTVSNKQFGDVKGGMKALTDMFAKQKVQSEEMTRQLTNAGIPAWQFLADALGVTVAKAQEMTKEGLVPANFALSAIADRMGSTYGPALKNFAFSWSGLVSSMADLKNLGLANLFDGIAQSFKPFAERFVAVMMQPETMATLHRWGEAIGVVAGRLFGFAEAIIASGDPIGFLAVAINRVIPGFFNLYEAVGRMATMFANLAGAAFGWGENIGMSFAQGIITAATYIIEAITYIGNIIASWLAPGSPPKLLPDLPEWGEQAAHEWFKGWTQADASLLKDLMGTVRDALENAVSGGALPEEGLIPMLMGGKDVMARAIYDIDHFGQLMEDTLDDLNTWTGRAIPGVKEIVDTFLDWEAASERVKDAQEDLTRINEEFEEQIRKVKDAYDEQLRPLNERMRGLKKEENQIRDNQRIAKLEETIRDDESTDEEKRLAQLEIQEILLKQQTDAIEEKRDTEVSALEEAQKKETELAQERLTAAQADEEAAKAAYESKQAQIGLQKEHNSLVAEQSKLLEQIAKQQAAAAGGGKGGGGKGKGPKPPGLPEGAGGPLNLGKDVLKDIQDSLDAFNLKATEAKKHWDDLKQRFLEAKKAAEDTATSIAPLSDLAAGIGLAFGSLAAGGIITFILNLVKTASPIGILIFAGTMLYKAWTENWYGIQQAVGQAYTFITSIDFSAWFAQLSRDTAGIQSFTLRAATDIETAWNTQVLPAIQTVAAFFEEKVIPVIGKLAVAAIPVLESALNLLGSIWTNIVVPAAQFFWQVITELVWPVVEQLAGVLMTTLLPALTKIADFISTTVLPVFKTDVFPFLRDVFIPLVLELARVVGEILRIAFEYIVEKVDLAIKGLTTLKCWFDDIKKPVEDLIQPLKDMAEQTGFVDKKSGDLVGSLFGVRGQIDRVIAGAQLLAYWLGQIHIPSDLLGHSPSPFEEALLGIVEASGDLRKGTADMSGAFDDATNVVDGFQSGIDGLNDILKTTIQRVKDLQEALDNLDIPEDLTPGSPTPFEIGIRGITSAIDAMIAAVASAPSAFAGLKGMTGELWKKFDDIQKKARELIEDLQQMVLKSTIGGFGEMIDNLKTVRDLWDGVKKAVDAVADAMQRGADASEKIRSIDQTIADLQDELAGKPKVEETKEQRIQRELAEAYAQRAEEEQKLIQAEADRQAAEERRQNLQFIADQVEQDLELARAEYLEKAKTDPENAQALFDLKSKQIKELGSLEVQIANTTDEKERASLMKQRDFLIAQQQIELDLFEHQAQRRVDAWKEKIAEIAQAWADIWEQPGVFVGEGITEEQAMALQNLYNWIIALQGISLPTWLTPGSPTPLELGLRGITTSMLSLAQDAIPAIRAQFQLMAQPASAAQIGALATAQSFAYTYAPQFNLGVTTNQSPGAVFQSYEIMRSLYSQRGR